MNDTISGRMDMLNSINTALQNVLARPAETKPYRISDLVPRNWEGNNEKGELRSFYVRLALVDARDNNAIAFDCSDKSSDRLRHRSVKSCTERQQTSH